jgi:hypothetical protein
LGIGILAPVPAVLLRSALETCQEHGLVGFGTNAVEFFEELDAELPVVIYPTVHYGDPEGYGRYSFQGTYTDVERADEKGLHRNPRVRPAKVFDAKEPDTPWRGFWHVKDLCKLTTRIPVEKLTALNKKTHLPKGFVPDGPLLVKADFLDA